MFETVLRTESKEEADALFAPKTAGRLETTVGIPSGIHAGIYKAMHDAGLKARFVYPAVERDVNYIDAPGNGGVANFYFARESARRLNKPMTEVPLVIEAASQEEAEKIAELIRSAPKPESREERALKAALAAGVVELDGKRYRMIEVVDAGEEKTDGEPTDEKADSDTDEKESAAEKEADRRYIVRQETDGDGVTRSEEIVEEMNSAEEEQSPVEEVQEETTPELTLAKKEEDFESKLLAAFKLADISVELGIIDETDKMALIAEIEEESLDQIEARTKTLEQVRTAGLVRRGSVTKQIPGLKRVPRLAHSVPQFSDGGTLDSIPDAALFL